MSTKNEKWCDMYKREIETRLQKTGYVVFRRYVDKGGKLGRRVMMMVTSTKQGTLVMPLEVERIVQEVISNAHVVRQYWFNNSKNMEMRETREESLTIRDMTKITYHVK